MSGRMRREGLFDVVMYNIGWVIKLVRGDG